MICVRHSEGDHSIAIPDEITYVKNESKEQSKKTVITHAQVLLSMKQSELFSLIDETITK